MRDIWKKVKNGIILLSEKHSGLYTFCYILCFVLMLAAGAGLPDVLKSVFYPIVFEKQETEGIITGIIKDEIQVASGRPRKAFLPVCYFEVDGFQILVTSGIARKYQEGEWYSYYIYERDRVRIVERKNYTLIYGVAGGILETFIFFVGTAFLLTETRKKEMIKQEEVKKGEAKAPRPLQNYGKLKTKELYELCLARNLKVMNGKKNSRQYLEQCLRNADDMDIWRQKQRKQEKRTEHGSNIICVIVILLMIYWCSRTIYYFIMLF